MTTSLTQCFDQHDNVCLHWHLENSKLKCGNTQKVSELVFSKTLIIVRFILLLWTQCYHRAIYIKTKTFILNLPYALFSEQKRYQAWPKLHTHLLIKWALFCSCPSPYAARTASTPLGGFPIRHWDRLQETLSCWNRKVFPRRLQQIWKKPESGFSYIQLLKSQSLPLPKTTRVSVRLQHQFQNIKDVQLPVDALRFTAIRATGSSRTEKTFIKHNQRRKKIESNCKNLAICKQEQRLTNIVFFFHIQYWLILRLNVLTYIQG